MRRLTARQIEKILKKHNFVLVRQRGSHRIYRSRTTSVSVPVPFHGGNRTIPIGTLKAIIQQSKLSRHVFE